MPVAMSSLFYVIAAICFILALRCLSAETLLRRGVFFAVAGLVLAGEQTLAFLDWHNGFWVVLAAITGATVGWRIVMKTSQPDGMRLIAGFQAFIGLAIILIAAAVIMEPAAFDLVLPKSMMPWTGMAMAITLALAVIILAGSVTAVIRAGGAEQDGPVAFDGQHALNLGLAVFILVLSSRYGMDAGPGWMLLLILSASAALGVLLILCFHRQHMRVAVMLLVSCSGWAGAASGFLLANDILVLAGGLVGASAVTLAANRCKTMNQSLFSVILGRLGAGMVVNTDK